MQPANVNTFRRRIIAAVAALLAVSILAAAIALLPAVGRPWPVHARPKSAPAKRHPKVDEAIEYANPRDEPSVKEAIRIQQEMWRAYAREQEAKRPAH
jgi:hypothetical protein